MVAKISLKFVVDEAANRVVFAESDRVFVDLLFSFLVTPLGAVVRSVQDQLDSVGAVDAIHRSVNSLDVDYLSTKACRDMLLSPIDANGACCNGLPVHVNENSFHYYKCPLWQEGNGGRHCFFSTTRGAICACGEIMNAVWYFLPLDSGEDVGVFLRGNHKYMITDDLLVCPMSATVTMAELKKLGVENLGSLREKTVEIGKDKVLALFKHALQSKTALSDVFFGKSKLANNNDPEKLKIASDLDSARSAYYGDNKLMKMTIVLSKLKGRVLYAEANEDVANFFFSFLTLPLGLISHLYNGSSSLGCIDNLRSSVMFLNCKGHMRTKEHTDMLLKPLLAPHHSFQNQILGEVKEGDVLHHDSYAINMKSNLFSTEKGGSFVKGPLTFMITDDLDIKVMKSGTQGISLMRNSAEPLDAIEAITFNLGEAQALKLLKATLTSTTPLSECFQLEENPMRTMARNLRHNTQDFFQNLRQGTQRLAANLVKPWPNLVLGLSYIEQDGESCENPVSVSIDLKLLALVSGTALLSVLALKGGNLNFAVNLNVGNPSAVSKQQDEVVEASSSSNRKENSSNREEKGAGGNNSFIDLLKNIFS